ncbi:hypothetical protein MMIC_P2052 [Mariprofundus micogutta]|uniref:BsuBI/PstI restriction endonuclease C-terminus n=1 Tax=Mariprofundus micogutta TaxID=1921010 RepID=A0A1L8CQA5_9PROT|nr:BsuBI/PstI family type II restriction endonuclease [Mariprofundus micogutta]GAV21073.1 hypothetical protein MMIC_P2052 [Mariprofundus micogutta]
MYNNDTGGLVQLPALSTLEEIRRRLNLIFPESFPDRTILVGDMAAKVIFVFQYGGFIDGNEQYLRPSFIYLFTEEQAKKKSDQERIEWSSSTTKPKFKPEGVRWYSDGTREPIRDDLIKNELIKFGVVTKLPGYATTSPKPTLALANHFSALFAPDLTDEALNTAIEEWRKTHLDQTVLQRMALKAKGIQAKKGDILIEMPDETKIRISAGPSSLIIQGLIEDYTKRHMEDPAVLWISESDQKEHLHLKELSESVGLRFDLNMELPDLILAEFGDPIEFLFCEIVASDGAITEARRETLLQIVEGSKIPVDSVKFLTAFEDREAQAFRKNFSKLAVGSLVWFRTEPELIVLLSNQKLKDL